MNIFHFCIFIQLIKYVVNGLKCNKNRYGKLYIQKKESLLFLNSISINKNLEKKKIARSYNEKQILKNNNDTTIFNKKKLLSFTKTKQIATVGPASERLEDLEKLYLSGIDVFRLNFSHGLRSVKKYIIDAIRILEKKYDTSIGILGDIQGPKIRIGEFDKNQNNEKEKNTYVELNQGDIFHFDLINKLGNKIRVQLNYPELLKNIKNGQIILLDDGNLKMRVIENSHDAGDSHPYIKVEVVTGGKLYSKKGFSTPNMIMPIEMLSEKDIKDILFCINEEIDFLGYSFVQTEYDLIFLKSIINDYYNSNFFKNIKKNRINYDIEKSQLKDFDDENDFYIKEVNDYYNNYYLKNSEKYKKIYDLYKSQNLTTDENINTKKNADVYAEVAQNTHNLNINRDQNDIDREYNILDNTNNNELIDDVNKIYIISKIEKPSAVKNIENIIKLSDGIMIARGDLGIETNLSNLPILQKRIINLCRIKYNKPVIVATQMLESMRFLPLPTRAEISDVATALYDGSDCVMLSAETATGQHPFLTASTQNNIIKDVEADYYYYEYAQKKNDKVKNIEQKNHPFHSNDHLSNTQNYNEDSYFEKLIYSIRDISNNMNLKSIILFSNEFKKILKLSNLRTKSPIIVITENVYLARKLQLIWGIYPYLSKKKNIFNNDIFSLINYGCNVSKEEGFTTSPDDNSLVTFTKNINLANMLYLCKPYLIGSN